jgi:hypothetical protein
MTKKNPTKENPAIKWFEKQSGVDCIWCDGRRKATGILRGSRNESFGPHCHICAAIRIRDAERVREEISKDWPQK